MSPEGLDLVESILAQFLQPQTLGQCLKSLDAIITPELYNLVRSLHRASFLETAFDPDPRPGWPTSPLTANSVLQTTQAGKRLFKLLSQKRELHSVFAKREAIEQAVMSAMRPLAIEEECTREDQIRQIHARAYQKWSVQEEERVISAVLEGCHPQTIAEELGRQETAVVGRIAKIIAGKGLAPVQAEAIPRLFAWYAGATPQKWRHLVTAQLVHQTYGRTTVVDVCSTPVLSLILLTQDCQCIAIPVRDFSAGLIRSLDLPADLDLHAGQPKSFPFFLQPVYEHHGIKYCFEYHPWRDGRNERFDEWSSQILRLKDRLGSAIEKFFQEINPLLGYGFAISSVPSHSPSVTHSGIRLLAQKLAQNGRRDATACLVRVKEIQKLSHGGVRSDKIHLDSIRVVKPELIIGQRVLLIDDVTTSGHSLVACRTLLLRSGAVEVECFALARTVKD